MRLFKRQAPNDMKKEDLIAKWWIITDPELVLIRGSPAQMEMRLLGFALSSAAAVKMHESAFILYSQRTYGG